MSEAFDGYRELGEKDKTIQRLVGASDVLAALGLQPVAPGEEPWSAPASNDRMFRKLHKQAVPTAKRARIRDFIEKVEAAIAKGDKLAADKAISEAKDATRSMYYIDADDGVAERDDVVPKFN